MHDCICITKHITTKRAKHCELNRREFYKKAKAVV